MIWVCASRPASSHQWTTIYLTHHFHGPRKRFTVRDGDGRDFRMVGRGRAETARRVGEILGLDDGSKASCEVIHFEMDDGDDVRQAAAALSGVYHPGKMKLLRQMKIVGAICSLFDPCLEATWFTTPLRRGAF